MLFCTATSLDYSYDWPHDNSYDCDTRKLQGYGRKRRDCVRVMHASTARRYLGWSAVVYQIILYKAFMAQSQRFCTYVKSSRYNQVAVIPAQQLRMTTVHVLLMPLPQRYWHAAVSFMTVSCLTVTGPRLAAQAAAHYWSVEQQWQQQQPSKQ
jgi:hypothetical protein